MEENNKTQIATFGNGCFWCTEAVFQQLVGVEEVTSGYSGGYVENFTYDKSGAFDKPIVTALEPFTNFFEAENYHRDYYKNHSSQPYCYFVIKPKMDKLKKFFADVLKK